MLQSVTEYYRLLQSITEYNRVLQNITKYYKVFLAHLLGPIFGLAVFVIVFLCLCLCLCLSVRSQRQTEGDKEALVCAAISFTSKAKTISPPSPTLCCQNVIINRCPSAKTSILFTVLLSLQKLQDKYTFRWLEKFKYIFQLLLLAETHISSFTIISQKKYLCYISIYSILGRVLTR